MVILSNAALRRALVLLRRPAPETVPRIVARSRPTTTTTTTTTQRRSGQLWRSYSTVAEGSRSSQEVSAQESSSDGAQASKYPSPRPTVSRENRDEDPSYRALRSAIQSKDHNAAYSAYLTVRRMGKLGLLGKMDFANVMNLLAANKIDGPHGLDRLEILKSVFADSFRYTLQPSQFFYNAIMVYCSQNGNTAEFDAAVESCSKMFLPIRKDVRTLRASCLTMDGRVDDAIEMISKAADEGEKIDIECNIIYALIKKANSSKDRELLKRAMAMIRDSERGRSAVSVNLAIRAHCNMDDIPGALAVIRENREFVDSSSCRSVLFSSQSAGYRSGCESSVIITEILSVLEVSKPMSKDKDLSQLFPILLKTSKKYGTPEEAIKIYRAACDRGLADPITDLLFAQCVLFRTTMFPDLVPLWTSAGLSLTEVDVIGLIEGLSKATILQNVKLDMMMRILIQIKEADLPMRSPCEKAVKIALFNKRYDVALNIYENNREARQSPSVHLAFINHFALKGDLRGMRQQRERMTELNIEIGMAAVRRDIEVMWPSDNEKIPVNVVRRMYKKHNWELSAVLGIPRMRELIRSIWLDSNLSVSGVDAGIAFQEWINSDRDVPGYLGIKESE